MLWSVTNANFRQYHISLIIHNVKTNKQHIVIFWQKNAICRKNTSWFWRKSRSYLSRETSIWIIWDFLMHLSESRVRKNDFLFHKLQAAGISVVTESLFGFTKLILHHLRAVTAASRASTIADLALGTTRQPEPYILWSRYTQILPCLTTNTDIYRLGASLCYSATSSITGKSVRHLEWVRNSCYCIEVLPVNLVTYFQQRAKYFLRKTY